MKDVKRLTPWLILAAFLLMGLGRPFSDDTIRFTVDNPKNLTADTTTVWPISGHTFVIDSIWAETRGSVDDFDFRLVEYSMTTSATTLIEAMQVSTETTNTFRADWFTSIDHATIESGSKITLVTPADSTNTLAVMIHGHYIN